MSYLVDCLESRNALSSAENTEEIQAVFRVFRGASVTSVIQIYTNGVRSVLLVISASVYAKSS